MVHIWQSVIRGSGNVYRDLDHDDADVKQFKALRAARMRLRFRCATILLVSGAGPRLSAQGCSTLSFAAAVRAIIDVPPRGALPGIPS